MARPVTKRAMRIVRVNEDTGSEKLTVRLRRMLLPAQVQLLGSRSEVLVGSVSSNGSSAWRVSAGATKRGFVTRCAATTGTQRRERWSGRQDASAISVHTVPWNSIAIVCHCVRQMARPAHAKAKIVRVEQGVVPTVGQSRSTRLSAHQKPPIETVTGAHGCRLFIYVDGPDHPPDMGMRSLSGIQLAYEVRRAASGPGAEIG